MCTNSSTVTFSFFPSAICISGSHNPLQRMKKKVGGFVDACDKKYFFWEKLWFGIFCCCCVGLGFFFCNFLLICKLLLPVSKLCISKMLSCLLHHCVPLPLQADSDRGRPSEDVIPRSVYANNIHASVI